MKIETQTREDHQVQIITEMESEEIESFKRRAARQIASKSKIPGFRPGKAPYDVVKRFYGEEAIQQQAIELMVDDVYPKMLKEANIDPGGPGQLEEIVSIDPPKFSFLVPLAPQVTLSDYLSMRKEYELPTLTDEDVEKVILNIQRNFATAEPVERPAEKGDMVYLKIKGDLDAPQEIEEHPFIQETPLQVVIGEENTETGSWPYEGFSNEIIGLTADSEKEIQYTFPEESPYERFRGKTVTFHITVQGVKKLSLPELDDEFAKTVGDFDTFDNMKTMIRKQLEENNLREYDDEYSSEVVDQIITQATIKYPPQVLEHEIEHVMEALEQDLAKKHIDLDTYLKTRQLDREKFIETEAKQVAKRRLERSLVLDELARAENIQIQNEELRNAITQRMMEMQSQGIIDIRKYKTASARQEISENIAFDTARRLMKRNILIRLKSIASGQSEIETEAESDAIEESVTEEFAPQTTGETAAEVETLESESSGTGENTEDEYRAE